MLELGGDHDYRLDRLRNFDVYLTPLGAWANAKLDEAFRALSGGADGEPRVLRTQGRDVEIPRAAPGVAMADFLDWCARPMGAADFICIADQLPHRDRGRHPQDGTGQPGQGGALRHHDRRILREESEVHLLCCDGAERPLPSKATAPSSSSAPSRG